MIALVVEEPTGSTPAGFAGLWSSTVTRRRAVVFGVANNHSNAMPEVEPRGSGVPFPSWL